MPSSVLKRASWGLLLGVIAAAVSTSGCDGGGQAQSQLVASIHLVGASGVAAVEVDVLRSTDHCGAASRISRGSISVGATASDALIGRVTFAVAPGAYRLCARPLAADGGAAPIVSPVEATATVGPGATVEVTLTLGMAGDGGVDATVNDAASDQGDDARVDAGNDERVDAGDEQRPDAGNDGSDARDTAGPEVVAVGDGCQLQTPEGLLGDFDGDGVKDCVARPEPYFMLNFHKGLGGGTYQQSPVVSAATCLPGAGQDGVKAVADLDGDHRDDLVLTVTPTPFDGPTSVVLLVGHTDGTFQCPQTAASVAGAPVVVATHAIADFNGDGRQDVFFVQYTGGKGNKAVHWIAVTGAPGSTAVTVHDTPANFVLGGLGSLTSLVSGNADADAYVDVTVDLTVRGMSDGVAIPQTLVIHGNGDATFKCGAGSMTVACPNPTPVPTVHKCDAGGAFGVSCVAP